MAQKKKKTSYKEAGVDIDAGNRFVDLIKPSVSKTFKSGVITDIGVYGFAPDTKEMQLLSLHPGRNTDDVCNNSGFEILIPEKYEYTLEPTEEELRVLRDVVDPLRYIIGR